MDRLLTVLFIVISICCFFTNGTKRRYFSIIKYRHKLNRNAIKLSHIFRRPVKEMGRWGRRQLIGSWRNLNDSVIEKKLDHMYRKLKDKVNYNVTLKTNGTHFNLGFTENSYLGNKHVVGIKDGFITVNSTLRKDDGGARHEINRINNNNDGNSENTQNQNSTKKENTNKQEKVKDNEVETGKENEKGYPQVSWTMRKEDNATENNEKQSEHAQQLEKQHSPSQENGGNQSKVKQFKEAATKSGKKSSEQFNKIVKAKDANLFDMQNADALNKTKETNKRLKKKEGFKKETDNGSADDSEDPDPSDLRNEDDSDDATASMSPPHEVDSKTLNSEVDVEVGNVDDSPETSNRDYTPNKGLNQDEGWSGTAPSEENQTRESKTKFTSEKNQTTPTNSFSNQSKQQKKLKTLTKGKESADSVKVHDVAQNMLDKNTEPITTENGQADVNDNGSTNEEQNTSSNSQSNLSAVDSENIKNNSNDGTPQEPKEVKNTNNNNNNKNNNEFNNEANNVDAVKSNSKAAETNDVATNDEENKNEKAVKNSNSTETSRVNASGKKYVEGKNQETKSEDKNTSETSDNTETQNENDDNNAKDGNNGEMSFSKDTETTNTKSKTETNTNGNADSTAENTNNNNAESLSTTSEHVDHEKSENNNKNNNDIYKTMQNQNKTSVEGTKSENDKTNTLASDKNVEQKEISNYNNQNRNMTVKTVEHVLSSFQAAATVANSAEANEDLYKEPADQRELNAKETPNGEFKPTGGFDPDEPEGSSIIKDVSSVNKIAYSDDKNKASMIDDVGSVPQNPIPALHGEEQLKLSTNNDSESTDKIEVEAKNQKKKEEEISSKGMKQETNDFEKEEGKEGKEDEKTINPEEIHQNPAPQLKIAEQFKELEKDKKMKGSTKEAPQKTNNKTPEKADSVVESKEETKDAVNEKTEKTDSEDIHANPGPTSSVEEQFKQMENTKGTKQEIRNKSNDKAANEKTESTDPEDLHKNPGPTSTVEEQFKEMAEESKTPSTLEAEDKHVNHAGDETSATASKESKDTKEDADKNTDNNEAPETLHQNPAPTSKVEEQFKELEKQVKENKDQSSKEKTKKVKVKKLTKDAEKNVEIAFLEPSEEASKEDSSEAKVEEKTEPEDLHKNPTPSGNNQLKLAKDSIFRFRQHKDTVGIHTGSDDEGESATIDEVMNAIEHKNTSQLLNTHLKNMLKNPSPEGSSSRVRNNEHMVVKEDEAETAQNTDLMDYNLDDTAVSPQLTVKVASGSGKSPKTTNFHEIGLRAKDDPDDGSNVVSPTHPKKEPISSKQKQNVKNAKEEEKPPEIPRLIDMDDLDDSMCTVAKKLTVKFNYANGSVLPIDCGENYNYTSAFDHPPKLTLDRANVNGIYTLLFVDADAPSPLYPIARCTVHWMIVNIMDADLDTGTEIVSYRKPNPQTTTGPHRFAFLLLKQKSLEPKGAFNINRCRLDINEFAFHHNITYIEGFKYFSTQSNIDYLVLTQPQVKSASTK